MNIDLYFNIVKFLTNPNGKAEYHVFFQWAKDRHTYHKRRNTDSQKHGRKGKAKAIKENKALCQ